MRKLYKILASVFAALGLMTAISNIALSVQSFIFFRMVTQPLIWPFLLMMLFGLGAGFFLALALMSGSKKGEDPTSEDF